MMKFDKIEKISMAEVEALESEMVDSSVITITTNGGEEVDGALDKFKDLCNDLNLDTPTKENTWRTYTNVRQKYMLEGEVSHWLCCAIYVACRQANIPSINSQTMHGSYVNLTRLLRTSGLSLVQFFDKSRKWGDMTNLNQEYRSKIERLERNFAVTTVIFKKFEPIFSGIFKDFSQREYEETRVNRKKLSPKSPSDLFEFCWTLFLCVKSSLRISDDLVNSYHLLLSCVDFVFHNVVQAGRKNLLTPQFQEIADSMENRGESGTCIIHTLCDLYDGISVEAKTIKEFWLRPKIKNMIENSILRGDTETLSLIDETFFEYNSRQLEKEYEEYVLTEGDFDERMYLSSDPKMDFGTNGEDYLRSIDKSPTLKTYPPLMELRHLMPQTPLTCKKYITDKEELQTPISTATQTVSSLQTLLSGRTGEPSPGLRETFGNCVRNPEQGIASRLERLSSLFLEAYTSKNGNNQIVPGFHAELAAYRIKLAEILYYRILESILSGENKIRSDKNELSELLEEENFHKSLFALSVEIILFSYHSKNRFPWILEVFDLPSYHFYKVIEVAVRAEEGLCRDVVKNLSQIEERILEELAWKGDSPLWEALALQQQKEEPIPSCDEVFLPSQMEKVNGINEPPSLENAPKRYAVIKTAGGVEKCVPVAVGENTSSTLIIQDKMSSQILGVVLPSKHGEKAKKNNSTALFFRKFYHLSFVRLQDLCKNLKVEDEQLRKIWTCFQQAIVNHVDELMRSRHLDQILMCCVYVVSKVVGQDKTFTDIMRYYRLQPQSASHVYRSVLLDGEDRGDLIGFYNSIFISRMQKYALKFSPRGANEDLAVKLSPVPQLKPTPMSPVRKLCDKHSVFLRPLRIAKTPSPNKQLRYNFNNRSPANNLKAINVMIQGAGNLDMKPKAVKRLLNSDENMEEEAEGGSGIPSKMFVKRLQDFIEDHRQLE